MAGTRIGYFRVVVAGARTGSENMTLPVPDLVIRADNLQHAFTDASTEDLTAGHRVVDDLFD